MYVCTYRYIHERCHVIPFFFFYMISFECFASVLSCCTLSKFVAEAMTLQTHNLPGHRQSPSSSNVFTVLLTVAVGVVVLDSFLGARRFLDEAP